jgi:D-alanyl-D-alanine carboxypeptidase
MMSDLPPIIDTAEASNHTTFPILWQLIVLATILISLFGYVLFTTMNRAESSPATVLPATSGQESQQQVQPQTVQKLEGIELTAKAAYVWDVKSQRALYAKNEDEALPLASITKLMTALLAHELVAEQTKTSVPLSAIMQEGSSGLYAGEQFDMATLNQLALISSSNDAAYTMAASVGSLLGEREPAQQFITGMNIRAEELGLTSLKFKSVTGLDISPTEPGSIGSARDVSFLMEQIVQNYPEILEPTKQSYTRVYNTAGEYHDVKNTNEVVSDIPNLIGSKTGYTDLAGGNLTIAFDLGFDRPIIVTVLQSTRDERFADVLTLVRAVQESVLDEN